MKSQQKYVWKRNTVLTECSKKKTWKTLLIPRFFRTITSSVIFKFQSLIISGVTGKRRTFFSKLGYGLDFWLVALSAKDVGSVSL